MFVLKDKQARWNVWKTNKHVEVLSGTGQQQCVCEVVWKIEKEMLRRYDTDGDGILSSAEIQASVYFINEGFEEIQ